MKPINFSNSNNQRIAAIKQPNPTLRALALGLALAGCGVQAFAATTYTMTDLSQDLIGTTPANTYPLGMYEAGALNNKGQVFGHALSVQNTPVGTTLYGYRILTSLIYNSADKTWTDVSTLADGTPFLGRGPFNSNGQLLGWTAGMNEGLLPPDISKPINMYIRNADGTVLTVEPVTNYTVGAANYSGININAFNDSGAFAADVVGPYQWLTASVYGATRSGYIGNLNNGNVTSGNIKPIGSLMLKGELYDDTNTTDINAKNQAVGYSKPTFAGQYHAFVSIATGLKDLHSPAMPFDYSQAFQINDSGFAIGFYQFANSLVNGVFTNTITHAIVWDTSAGKYTDMGSTDPKTTSAFHAINNSGQVLGYEKTFNGIRLPVPPRNRLGPEGVVAGSVHWLVGDINGGGLQDLNTLITNKPIGANVSGTVDINNAGQILAYITDSANNRHVVLLTPATLPDVIPVAPSNLTTVATSSTQINLTWADNANNETAQYVERCAGAGCTNFAQVASLAANVTSYSDTSLTAGTSYSYRVRAHGAAGDSAYSNTATVSTTAATNTAPAAPSNLISSATTMNQVVLAWADNAINELSYLIERCKGASCANFAQVARVGANVTTYSNAGLSRNTSYSYRVRAANAKGKSAYSNTLSVKTLP
ncbi:MAG: hypothetical protein ABL933_06490 [Methyloglobulus sp.]|nr:hypothetical protein [Methyloglobulus sp.]